LRDDCAAQSQGLLFMVKAEFRGMLTGLTVVAVLTLIAISVDVGIPGQDLLQSIRFHLAAAMLVLPILLALNGAWLRGLLVLGAILLSVGEGGLSLLRQQDLREPLLERATLAEFSLLNYNVLSGNLMGAEAAELVVTTAPDIAVIMEAPGIERYFDRLATVLPYRVGCDEPQTCDLALFSRTPLIDAGVQPLGPLRRLRLITARTIIGGQMVTLVAVHLSKPYFDENADAELFHIWRVLRDMEGPLVVTGDFNAAPWSRALIDSYAPPIWFRRRNIPPHGRSSSGISACRSTICSPGPRHWCRISPLRRRSAPTIGACSPASASSPAPDPRAGGSLIFARSEAPASGSFAQPGGAR
jgi:endonuclease/exonuclease/phosphatase (EEP) superfamily protein YafD